MRIFILSILISVHTGVFAQQTFHIEGSILSPVPDEVTQSIVQHQITSGSHPFGECRFVGQSIFEGTYTRGHEVNVFSPCGEERTLWVIADSAELDPLREYHREHTTENDQPIYISFRGTEPDLEPDGFAELYDSLIRIDELLETSTEIPPDCNTVDKRTKVNEVAPAVEQVVSGGAWETSRSRGRYRAVIENTGFEHVHSKLWLEWIANPADPSEIKEPYRIVSRVLVVELSQGAWSLGIVETERAFRDGRLHLRGTDPYSGKHRTFTIEVGEPGIYQVL